MSNLATFAEELDLTASNSSADSTTIFGLDTYALQLQDIDPDIFNGQTFSVNLGSVEDAIKLKGDIQDGLMTSEEVMKILQNSTASLQLPDNFLQGCSDMYLDIRQLRLSYSVFLTDILFQSQANRSAIGSIVVATHLGYADNTSLLNPIRVHFRTVKEVFFYNLEFDSAIIMVPMHNVSTLVYAKQGAQQIHY